MSSAKELCVADAGASHALREPDTVERLGRIGHWYWPAGSRDLSWSHEAARIHGVETFPIVLLDAVVSAYSRADGARLLESLHGAIRTGAGFEFEAVLALPSGVRRDVRVIGRCDRDENGRALGVLVIVKDLSEYHAALAALATAEQRHADFLQTASDWMWEMGPDLRFTYISEQADRLTGVPAAEHTGKSRRDLIRDDEITPEIEAHLLQLDRHEPFRDFRYWRTGLDGRLRCISTSGRPIYGANGEFLGYRGTGRDITGEQQAKEDLLVAYQELSEATMRLEAALEDLRQVNALLAERNAEMAIAQAEIRHAALHDPLTGLPNRRYLDEKLAGLAEVARAGTVLGALHIDLDRFKQINDTAGHAAGDAVLRHVAQVLLRSLAQGDFAARVGGDEFVIISAGRREAALETFARALIGELERPLVVEGRECWFGASIGIAASSGPAFRADELLVNADIALYRAKKRGRCTHEFFSPDVQRQIVRYKAMADGVLAGLKRGEFVPHYQPQISADSARIVGVEALVRWYHPEEGVLGPAEFLQVADDLGVVAALDRVVLERAMDDLGRWRAAGLDVPKLSVNVSARRLHDPELIECVSRMGLPRGIVAFELLESVFLDDANETIAWNIDMLKEMGIEIELDDFGSGHASIVSLVKLGPDAIKIDRELISSITADRTRCGLVRSIIEIGRSLDTRIIAEGVETAAQAELLHSLGCDALQGYHFGKPMTSEEFQHFVRSWCGGERAAALQTG